MSLQGLALVLIAGTLVMFLLIQAIALVGALRRSPASAGISRQTRIAWNLAPLAMVTLIFISLILTGRISL